MNLSALPASYLTWLFGQSAVVVVLTAWIWTQHREKKILRKDLMASRKRSDELSDSLVEVLLDSSRQQSERREKTLMRVLETIEKSSRGSLGD